MSDSIRVRITGDLETLAPLLGRSDNDEIRAVLGRDLDAAELATFDSLDAITPVEAVVMKLVERKLHILAVCYLEERLPGARMIDAKVGVGQIEKKYRP